MIHNMAAANFTAKGVVVVVGFEFVAVVHEALVTEFPASGCPDNWTAGFLTDRADFAFNYFGH